MKLAAPINTESVVALGTAAVHLLCDGNINALAARFGYALSYGREPASAIREDLRRCLAEVGANGLAFTAKCPVPNVKYFTANDAELLAVVECVAPTDNNGMLFVELVVSRKGAEKHITLEEISASPREHP